MASLDSLARAVAQATNTFADSLASDPTSPKVWRPEVVEEMSKDFQAQLTTATLRDTTISAP